MKYVFFHSDLDGYTGGSILKLKYPDFKYIECTYDNRVEPLKILKPGDYVLIVDYSFLPEEMLWVRKNCKVVWLDHHKSAIEDSEKHGYSAMNGIRKQGVSGAEIAWNWVFPDKDIPRFVSLVGDYDVFRTAGTETFDKETIPFYFGSEMFLPGLNPLNYGKNTYIFKLENLERLTDKFIELGRVVYQYKKITGRKLNEEYSYEREMFGLRVLCLNTDEVGSLCLTIPKTFDPAKHDMMLTYAYNGKVWSYGFYTDDKAHPEVDCSEIAKRFGGGGHPGAAGCTTESLIKELL